MAKFFRLPFAVSGDKTTIPDPPQVGGSVSYDQGFTIDYELPYPTNQSAKPVPRDQSNQLYNDITLALQQYQTQGFYDFITPGLNDGSPYPYDQNVVVRYDDGNGVNLYLSTEDSNDSEPTVDTIKWQGVNLAVPNKNIIIGGSADTNPWQRQVNFPNAFATYGVSSLFTADRWSITRGGDSTVDVTVLKSSLNITSGIVSSFSDSSFEIEITTAQVSQPGATEYLFWTYIVEGYDALPIIQNNGTTSFIARSDVSGIYSVAVKNAGFDRTLVFEYELASGISKLITLVIPPSPADGTWNYTNGIGLVFNFSLMPSSESTSTIGIWQNGDFSTSTNQVNFAANIGNRFNIDLVKLEQGKIFTGYYEDSVHDIFARCQRYYQKSYEFLTYNGTITTLGQAYRAALTPSPNIMQEVRLPVQMRAVPNANSFSVNSGAMGQLYKASAPAADVPSSVQTTEGTLQFSFNAGVIAGDELLFQYAATAEIGGDTIFPF